MLRFYKRKTPEPDDHDDINWEEEIKYDPGLRKLIDNYHPNQRERVRRRDNKDAGYEAFVVKRWNGFHRKDRLNTHVGDVGSLHYKAMKKCEDLLKTKQHIDVAFKTQSEEGKQAYLTRLNGSINVARMLVKQDLSFRGHDESEKSYNKGNFREFHDYTAEQNPKLRKVTRPSASANSQLIAPEIQRDIVECFAMEILHSILEELGDDVFCLLVDESRDVSCKEQMAVVLRYVDKCGIVKERFVGLVHVKETTSASLKSSIDALFVKLKLSLKQVRGQGYDGASNMRGELNGLQSLIMRESPTAYYVHCFAHQLQLVLVAIVRKHGGISDFFSKISDLLNIVVGSAKRRDLIRDINHENVSKALGCGQLQTGTGLNQEQCLQRPGDTRWSSHYKTLKGLFDMFPTVVEVLEVVRKDERDWKHRDKASNLLDYFQTFDFALYLQLMLTTLTITNILSQALQRKDQDIVNAIKCVKSTRCHLDDLRRNGWEKVLAEAYDFCDKHDIIKLGMEDPYIDPKKRRKESGITNRHYYQVDCFNEVLDWILRELDSRFNETSSELLVCSSAFSPRDSFHEFNIENLMSLAKLYPTEFNTMNLRDLRHQLSIYIIDVREDDRFSNIETIAELSQKMVETRKHLTYHLVYRLLKLVLVLPVATAAVERCFSAMKIVKTYLRNKIGDDFLSHCLIGYVEKELMRKVTNESVAIVILEDVVDTMEKARNVKQARQQQVASASLLLQGLSSLLGPSACRKNMHSSSSSMASPSSSNIINTRAINNNIRTWLALTSFPNVLPTFMSTSFKFSLPFVSPLTLSGTNTSS
ncbi:hypothetical protein EJB05_28023, partial [Eragrostis curvula]